MKPRLQLLVIALTGVFNAHAQLDSLLAAEKSYQHQDTVRAKLLSEIAILYWSIDSEKMLYYVTEAEKLSVNIGYLRGKAKATNQKGIYYWQKGNYSEAISFYKTAISLYQQIGDDEGVANCFFNLGIINREQGNHLQALEYYLQSAKFFESIKNEKKVAITYNSIALVYTHQDDFENALFYYNKTIEIHKRLNNRIDLAGTFSNIGSLYEKKKDYRSAIEYTLKGLHIFDSLNNARGKFYSYNNLGQIYQAQKNYDQSIEYYKRAVDLNKTSSNKKALVASFVGLGQSYSALNKINEAEEWFMAARKLAEKEQLVNELELSYRGLAKTAYIKSDFKQSSSYYKSVLELSDSLKREENIKKLANLQKRFEVEKKENEIEILSKQNAIRELELQNEAIIRYGLIAGIGALITIIAYIFYNLRLKSKLVKTLTRQKREIELQNNRVKQLNEVLELKTLRAQINPHFLFNALGSIQNYIIKSDKEVAVGYMQKFSKLIRRVLESSMHLSISLKEEIELLKNYIELEQLRFDFKFDYEITCSDALNKEKITLPYLLIQPFVENAILHGVRHINDGFIKIQFDRDGDNLRCVIDDNGIGRKASQLLKGQVIGHRSVGMSITADRIKSLAESKFNKIELSVEDKEAPDGFGLGTSVTITIAINEFEFEEFNEIQNIQHAN